MAIVEIALIAAAVYLTIYASYLLLLLAAHLIPSKGLSGSDIGRTRFAIVIPAHNEELFLGRLLSSIAVQAYPKTHYDAVVVADNCTDSTASVARQYRAVVFERHDSTATGKGYALKYGIENIAPGEYDALVVVDADCMLDPDVLRVFDLYLRTGCRILQSTSAPANPGQSWFTRLVDVSHSVSNEIILKGKKRLGLSIPLMGTGMCFAFDILKQYGWSAFSIGEDWEFYIRLLSDGQRVVFANEAKVFHQESSNLKQATSQRMRWSSGRFAIARKYGLKLLLKSIREMDFHKADGLLLLLLPNPSLGINLTLIVLLCTVILVAAGLSKVFLIWLVALFLFQAVFFLLGIFYSKEKAKTIQAVLFAPVFLTWKMVIDLLSILGMGRKKWVRTKRTLP